MAECVPFSGMACQRIAHATNQARKGNAPYNNHRYNIPKHRVKKFQCEPQPKRAGSMSTTSPKGGKAPAWWRTLTAWWPNLARQHPVAGFFLVIIWPNAIWSVANLVYNDQLIVERFCHDEPEKKAVFWDFAVPFYSTLTWV